MFMENKITRQDVLLLNDAIRTLPGDIKDFEYQYCLIENTERLSKSVEKIKEALKAAASDEFLEKSKELAEVAGKLMQDAKGGSWVEFMEEAVNQLEDKDKEAFVLLQKTQAELEGEYLSKESDCTLYKIKKDRLPSPLPLDQSQAFCFRYFIE